MKRAVAIISVSVGVLAAATLLEVFRPSAYQQLRDLSFDALTRVGRTTAPNPDLVFLAIDSASVGIEEMDIADLYGLTEQDSDEARALRLMSEDYPWSREVYALVTERLVRAGAKVVLFDLTFPASKESDARFRLALDAHKPNVVIGTNFVSGATIGFARSRTTYSRPPESLVPASAPDDDRLGYTNFWSDPDGVVRRAQYRITFDQVEGLQPAPDAEQFVSLAARALVKAGHADAVPAGLDSQLFRYTGPPRVGFPPLSLFEIFVPDYWRQNYGSGEFFRGKIVLVGAEGSWAHDEHLTPFGRMPGPEIHLNAMNAALRGEFIRELPFAAIVALTLLATLVSTGVSLRIPSPWLRIVLLIALDILAAAAALLAFNGSTYVPLVAPLMQLNVTVAVALICDVAWEQLERNRVRRTLERYVSSNVVQELLGDSKRFDQSLGGVSKPVTILFSDIRGYSTVTANAEPHALVSQLNEYLSAMIRCVFRRGGTLDKFVGDAVMAVWGNVRSDGIRNDTANAVRAALDMRDELARLNADWVKRGMPEFQVGIAVHQGDVVVGNIGSAERMEFTVIGDAVNITWKLQELTKQVGSSLVVSGNIAPLLVEEFELQRLGHHTIPGRETTIEVFGVEGPIKVGTQATASEPRAGV